MKKQVLANKDASPFLCCFVTVVAVVVVVMIVVVAVVLMHMNVLNHSYSFSISKNRQNIEFWRIQRMRYRRMALGTDRRTDGPTDGPTDVLYILFDR